MSSLRMIWHDESYLPRLTSSAPPLTRSFEQSRAGAWDVKEEEEPADANGQNLSAAMIALIGNITVDTAYYGPRHPLRRALADYERICRRRHRPPTWKDHSTPICGEMLRATIEGNASIWWCAQYFEVSYPRAERLIAAGEAYIRRSLLEAEARLLGINTRAHGIDCPSPRTCAICSVDYSPSAAQKGLPVA